MKTQSLVSLFFVSALFGCSATNAADTNKNSTIESETSSLQSTPVVSKVPIYRQGLVTPQAYQYPEQDTFKVISWNVEHFLDEHDDPYIDNEREDDASERMGNKRAYLVDALKQANADIVVLQEFESAKLLRNIAQNELVGMGYEFFADAPSHGWYMNVVVMSRFPLGVLYSYGNANTPVLNYVDENGERETQRNLNTRTWAIDVFPSPDYSFLMSAVHLKAGKGERNIGIRLGQIGFLKTQFERFLFEDPDRNILLVGDLNAVPESQEHAFLLSGTNAGNTLVDPLGPMDFTHTAIEPQRRLDYAIMNENMLPEMVEGSIKPVYFFNPNKQDALADHLPVVAEFYIKDK